MTQGDDSGRGSTTFLRHALAVFTFAALSAAAVELLKVSDAPTRELYRAINAAYAARYSGSLSKERP